MKKLITFAAAAASAAVMLSTAAAAHGIDKAVVLGDSIATGYGLEGYTAGDNYSAPDSFGNMLAADCGELINLAVDGRTSAELLEALDTEAMTSAVSGADSIVISIGGNDFLQPIISAAQTAVFSSPELMSIFQGKNVEDLDPELAAEQITQAILDAVQAVDVSKSGENLDGILAKIYALNPTADVNILTVYNPFDGFSEFSLDASADASAVQTISFSSIFSSLGEIAESKLSLLNSAITAAAEGHGANVIDVYSAFKGHAAEYTNIMIMDIHPSKAGHAVIYSLLAAELNTAQTLAPAKNSPETGAESFAAAVGILLIASAGMIVLRKKL